MARWGAVVHCLDGAAGTEEETTSLLLRWGGGAPPPVVWEGVAVGGDGTEDMLLELVELCGDVHRLDGATGAYKRTAASPLKVAHDAAPSSAALRGSVVGGGDHNGVSRGGVAV